MIDAYTQAIYTVHNMYADEYFQVSQLQFYVHIDTFVYLYVERCVVNVVAR